MTLEGTTSTLCLASNLLGGPQLSAEIDLQRRVALQQAPQSLDRRLSIEAAGGEIAAVLRFERSATREATESAVARLRAALEQGERPSSLLLLIGKQRLSTCSMSALALVSALRT